MRNRSLSIAIFFVVAIAVGLSYAIDPPSGAKASTEPTTVLEAMKQFGSAQQKLNATKDALKKVEADLVVLRQKAEKAEFKQLQEKILPEFKKSQESLSSAWDKFCAARKIYLKTIVETNRQLPALVDKELASEKSSERKKALTKLKDDMIALKALAPKEKTIEDAFLQQEALATSHLIFLSMDTNFCALAIIAEISIAESRNENLAKDDESRAKTRKEFLQVIDNAITIAKSFVASE